MSLILMKWSGGVDSKLLNAFLIRKVFWLAKCSVIVQKYHIMCFNKALILQKLIYLILHMWMVPMGFIICWQQAQLIRCSRKKKKKKKNKEAYNEVWLVMVISITQNTVQGWFITDNECFPVLIAFNGWTNIIGEDEFFYSIAKSLVLQNHTLNLVHFLYYKPWRTFVYCAGDNCRDSSNSTSFPVNPYNAAHSKTMHF